MNKNSFKMLMHSSAASLALGFGVLASPVWAQEQAPTTPTAPSAAPSTVAPAETAPVAAADTKGDDANTIVVTGTLFRNTSATNVASPISVITADDLDKRGINTVQQAIQSLASNNGPALTNSFTANGAFAGGASSASLRGLTTNSTLTLFDGMRAAFYPLADDGVRNFVDLNTIPDEIVERVEVLRDGASSIYGADAIAGVINVITKRQITGITGTAEAGITERGDAANQRLSLTAGFGDLATQRFNVYVSGHYIHSASLYSRDRSYPYNSANQTGICFEGFCGPDNRENSPINYGGVSALVPVFLVRPADPTAITGIPGSRYQFLNPTTGCGGLTAYNPSAAELGVNGFPTSPTTVCTQDVVRDGGVIEPRITRLGGSARASVDIGDNTHAFLEFNFEQSTSEYTGYGLAGSGVPTNAVIRANAPAGIIYPRYSTSGVAGGANAPGSNPLSLPVYICPRLTVGPCTAANGTLNPNNPFAAAGQAALLIGTVPGLIQDTETRSRAYRLHGGINGSFGSNADWDWQVDGVGMVNDLRRTFNGYVYIQHLLDVIKDGSFNFVNPQLNSRAELDYLAPELNAGAKSQLYQVNASLSHNFFDLPGGPLQVAIGGSGRYESINDPSANPDDNGPTERYFVINAFGTVGHRYVESGYFQIKAPVLDILTFDGSGRYDHYSSGQSHFSPKGGVVFNPIKQLTLRGSISGGFRIPSFAETSALPTTGYVPYFSSLPNAFLAQYSNPGVVCTNKTPANCSSYVSTYSVGELSAANPNLKPETSRNITGGFELKPFRGLTIAVDYYNIRKKGAITTSPFSAALTSYYANGTIPAGYVALLNSPDVNHPNATPTLSSIGALYVNANTITTDGVDFSVTLNLPLTADIRLHSAAEAEYIHKLNTTFADGHTEHYAGTIGNYNLTAGTGTFHWKGNWQNTLEFGKKGSLSATVYYVDGYNLSAEDQGNVAGDCGLTTGYQGCNVHSFIDVDMNASINVMDNLTFYVNVLNVFDKKPPLDTVTYGGYLYNPVQAEQGIVGRAFRAGVKVSI